MEFTVPSVFDELLDESAPETCFRVRAEYDVADMSDHEQLSLLRGVVEALRGKDFSAITRNDVFDPLVAFARSFLGLNEDVKLQIWSSIHNGMATLSSHLSANLAGMQPQSTEAREARSAVKMLMYTLNLICLQEEGEAARATKHMTTAKKLVKQPTSRWDWGMQRTVAITTMGRMLQLDVCRLWPMSCPEEPFVNLFTRAAYVFLETPSVVRDKATKEDIFQLLGVLVQHYNHALGAATSIVHSLPHFEHLSIPMAHLLETFVRHYDGTRVVTEVLREIGRIDPKDMSRDTSGARHYAAFLAELGDRIPEAVLPSISLVLPQLDGEAYAMRSAILSVMGSILAKTLKHDKTESGVNARDQLFEMLIQRIHDTNAFTRSRDIQVWQMLATEKCIPLKTLKVAVPLLADRLGDKSSTVRKSALQLLNTLVCVNPYGAHLSVKELTKVLQTEQDKLTALTGEIPEEEAAAKKAAGDVSVDATEEEKQEKAGGDENPADDSLDVDALLSDSDDEEEKEEGEEGDAEAAPAAPEVEEPSETKQQRIVVQFVRDWKTFAEQVELVIPTACQLLGSTNVSDITSGVAFFVTLSEFQVDNAIIGVRKMLALMWSKETAAKDCVIAAYDRLYLSPDPATHPSAKAQTAAVVKSLINLTEGANLGDLTSLEEMVSTMKQKDMIPPAVVRMLWEVFAMRIPSTSEEQSIGALKILGMVAMTEPEVMRDNVGLLMSVGFGERALTDMLLFKDTCVALQKLVKKGSSKKRGAAPERFPTDHAMFQAILNVLTSCSADNINGWYPAAEQAINTIYLLAEHPDGLCEGLIRSLTARVFGGEEAAETQDTHVLGRLLFAVGHVALKQLVHLEYVEAELKRRHGLQDDHSEKHKRKAQATDEEDMGVGGASAEDAEAEFIAGLCEHDLVTGSGLLAAFAPILRAVCQQPAKYSDVALQTAAVLSLCKYMCVSAQFCDDNLQLLFTIMETSEEQSIRSNAMIALGDLAFRFPNLLEPWTAHLYSRLRDPEPRVRKNTLMVLTHLILNDMVKVKGQISEMAVCIEDPEQRIADLARLFFHELAHKGNAIYNLLPDIISQVADKASGMNPEQFRNIMGYLFSFIKKERQAESLIEKLCHRFRTTLDVQQWRHFAHCLSLLQLSERGAKKLIEQFPCYSDKLSDDEIFQSFTDILSKGRKFAKPDLKAAVAELELKIQACHEKGAEAAETAAKAAKVKGRAKKYRSKQPLQDANADSEQATPNRKKPASRRKATRKAKAKAVSSEESDSDIDGLDLSDEENGPARTSKATTAARRRAPPSRRVNVADSDDSDFDF